MKKLILLALFAGGLSITSTQQIVCDAQQAEQHEIKLYTYTWCPPCKAVKKFIKDNNLEDKVTILDAEIKQYADELFAISKKDICPFMHHVNASKTVKGSQEIIKYLKNLFRL